MARYKRFCQKTYNENDHRAKKAWKEFFRPLRKEFQLSDYDVEDCDLPDLVLNQESERPLYFEIQVSRSWVGSSFFPYPTFDLFDRKYSKLSGKWSHLVDDLYFVTLSKDLKRAIIAPAKLFQQSGIPKEARMSKPGEGFGRDKVITLRKTRCTEVALHKDPYTQLKEILQTNKQEEDS